MFDKECVGANIYIFLLVSVTYDTEETLKYV